jgi:hypothetical protein
MPSNKIMPRALVLALLAIFCAPVYAQDPRTELQGIERNSFVDKMQDELAYLVDSGVSSVIEAYIDAMTPQQVKDYLLSHWKENADNGILFSNHPIGS